MPYALCQYFDFHFKRIRCYLVVVIGIESIWCCCFWLANRIVFFYHYFTFFFVSSNKSKDRSSRSIKIKHAHIFTWFMHKLNAHAFSSSNDDNIIRLGLITNARKYIFFYQKERVDFILRKCIQRFSIAISEFFFFFPTTLSYQFNASQMLQWDSYFFLSRSISKVM